MIQKLSQKKEKILLKQIEQIICSLLILIDEQVVQLGLFDSGQVDEDSGGLEVLFLVLNFSRVHDVQDVTFAHVPNVEVVEGLNDLVLSAVDWVGLVVKQRQDVAERDRPKQLFSVEGDDVLGVGHSMLDAKFGQERLVFIRKQLPYDVLEGIAIHVLSLVLLFGLWSAFFDGFLHHLGQPCLGNCCCSLSLCFCSCRFSSLISAFGILLHRRLWSRMRRCISNIIRARVSAVFCFTFHLLLQNCHIYIPFSQSVLFHRRAGMLHRNITILMRFSWSYLCLSNALVLALRLQKAPDIALLCEGSNKIVAHGDDFQQYMFMSFSEDIILVNLLIHFDPRVQ